MIANDATSTVASEPSLTSLSTLTASKHRQKSMCTDISRAISGEEVMNRLRPKLSELLSDDFLKELEENNYYLDSPIPFDTLPQSEEEWMQMAAEAEESGYVTSEEFNKHCEAWSLFN